MIEHITIGESEDGRIFVFRCPHCPGWKRTFDTGSGTIRTENRNDIRHTGAFSMVPGAIIVTPPETIKRSKFYSDN